MRPITKGWAQTLICPIMSGKCQCKTENCMAWQYTATKPKPTLPVGRKSITPDDVQKLGKCLLIPDEKED